MSNEQLFKARMSAAGQDDPAQEEQSTGLLAGMSMKTASVDLSPAPIKELLAERIAKVVEWRRSLIDPENYHAIVRIQVRLPGDMNGKKKMIGSVSDLIIPFNISQEDEECGGYLEMMGTLERLMTQHFHGNKVAYTCREMGDTPESRFATRPYGAMRLDGCVGAWQGADLYPECRVTVYAESGTDNNYADCLLMTDIFAEVMRALAKRIGFFISSVAYNAMKQTLGRDPWLNYFISTTGVYAIF